MAVSVLIVEDDRNIAELLQMYLEKEGYAVTVAADGGQGLAKFRAIKPDLVLLDVMMPVMDGWAVCRAIRAESQTPVIMLTAKGETDDKVAGLKNGADDYITKPFEMKEVLARIEAVLRRSNGSAAEKKIIGQDEAVHLVAQAVKRSRADLSGRRRPASFIFVGPTGVGKTELVKQLANQLFDGPDPLIRLDMSEYMEKYAVSRMIGSPPGYVGYEEAGQLTEKVRRRPYSVVLFDEIEKAHPDVMNILLQILDEGKINDALGRTVDFSNTVICMTSNAGSSDQTSGGLGFNKSEEQRSEEKTRKALAQFLRPEFLGRVDEVIAFKPLSQETLEGIAALMLDEYKPSMAAKGIAYSYTPAALKALVTKSQGGKFGARDLRRVIRKAVEDPAAERLIDGTLASGSALTVDADADGEVVLK